MKKNNCYILIILFIVLFVSCAKNKKPTISFEEYQYNITIGQSFKVTPIVNNVDNKNVTYNIVDQTVLEYKDNLFVGKMPGTTKIIVALEEYPGIKKEIKVTVKIQEKKVETINITGEKQMYIHTSQQLYSEVLPDDADNKFVSWITTNSNIASVDQNGKVEALKEGKVTILAYATDDSNIIGYFYLECLKEPISVQSIKIYFGTDSVSVGNSISLLAVVLPDEAKNKNVAWSSNDNSIATVNKGIVTGIKEGTVIITASSTDGSRIKETIKINVIK